MILKKTFENYFAKTALSKILKKNNIHFEDVCKNIYVGFSQVGGLGVFSFASFKKNEIIEICPIIQINNTNISDDLADFLFEDNSNEQDNDVDMVDKENEHSIVNIIFKNEKQKKKKKKMEDREKEKEIEIEVDDKIKTKIEVENKNKQKNCKLLPLGYGILYNHSETPNAYSKIIEGPSDNKDGTKQKIMLFIANKQIEKHEEIFISYGKMWWRHRNWEPIPTKDSIMSGIFYPSKD